MTVLRPARPGPALPGAVTRELGPSTRLAPGECRAEQTRVEREERGQKPAAGGYTVILSYNNVTEEFSPRLNIVVYECLHISKIKEYTSGQHS